MRRAALFTAVAVLMAASASPAEGQVCFNGRPEPRCSGFMVLEFTMGARFAGRIGTNDSPVYIYWSGGYLENIGPRSALGAAFKLTADQDGHRYGPVLRYRRWLGRTWNIDLAPGVYLGGKDNFTSLQFPSPTADVALNYRNWVGLAVGIDALRQRGRDTEWQGHAGLRFGTWLAPIATIGLGLLIGATYD